MTWKHHRIHGTEETNLEWNVFLLPPFKIEQYCPNVGVQPVLNCIVLP